jgi:hypothetical protein
MRCDKRDKHSHQQLSLRPQPTAAIVQTLKEVGHCLKRKIGFRVL